MASDNHVSSRTPRAFGHYLVADKRGCSANAVANAVAAMPLFGGGLTNSGNSATSGTVILRRAVVANPSADIHTTNVSIGLTNDGANLVVASAALTNCNATVTYQDLTLVGNVALVTMNGNISSTLYVNITSNAVTNATFDVMVYGDTVIS